jgi:hypothetical protein
MADNNTATVNVPTELLKPIIEAKVVEALSGSENLMQGFVSAIYLVAGGTEYEGHHDTPAWAIDLALDQARDGLEETIREASEGLRSVNKILRAKP